MVSVSHRTGTEQGASPRSEARSEQYSLPKILTVWALAAVPMPILAFVVAPATNGSWTGNAILNVWLLMIAGMMWQFVLSIILLNQECSLRDWSAIKERIWLKAPRDPRSGKANAKLFWWLIPAFLFYLAVEVSSLGSAIGELILVPLPNLEYLPALDLAAIASSELEGAWWLIGVAMVSCVFNYVLGEELLFRGILLPKMRGVFGSWDWVANSALFGLYHLHRPTQILGFAIGGLAWTLTTRRFQSIWFGIILHGIEGLFVIGITVAIVLGVAL